MSKYALINAGLVVNIVYWDGGERLFEEDNVNEIGEDDYVGVGFEAVKSKGAWKFNAPKVMPGSE